MSHFTYLLLCCMTPTLMMNFPIGNEVIISVNISVTEVPLNCRDCFKIR